MKLGVYTAVLHDKPLAEALRVIRDLGLTSAEINSGGFVGTPHLPTADLRASRDARDEYLAQFAAAGVELTALNCNGNPLHPDPEVRDKHGRDVLDSIELAALLGVRRVVTMSGLPANGPGGTLPAWTTLPWETSQLDARDWQWTEVALPYWKDVQARPPTPTSRCASRCTRTTWSTTRARWSGSRRRSTPRTWAPSWTQPPVLAGHRPGAGRALARRPGLQRRGEGHPDQRGGEGQRRPRRPLRPGAPGEPGYLPLGGRYTLSRWPENSSWDFVAVGRGHDVEWWAEFLRALAAVDSGHGGEHRARGPGARPARRPPVRRAHPARRPLQARIRRRQ
jgi:sugar phosphate isomerase/epimerase